MLIETTHRTADAALGDIGSMPRKSHDLTRVTKRNVEKGFDQELTDSMITWGARWSSLVVRTECAVILLSFDIEKSPAEGVMCANSYLPRLLMGLSPDARRRA